MSTLPIAMLALMSALGLPMIVEEIEYYDITGSSSAELRESIDRLRPTDQRGQPHDAVTDWDLAWQFRLVRNAEGCSISSLEVRLDVVAKFPRWTNRQTGTSLTTRWDRYTVALKRHEEGHLEIARRGATTLHEKLSGLTAPTCPLLRDLANSTGRALVKALNEEDSRYDQQTEHGVLQGATLR